MTSYIPWFDAEIKSSPFFEFKDYKPVNSNIESDSDRRNLITEYEKERQANKRSSVQRYMDRLEQNVQKTAKMTQRNFMNSIQQAGEDVANSVLQNAVPEYLGNVYSRVLPISIDEFISSRITDVNQAIYRISDNIFDTDLERNRIADLNRENIFGI